MHLHSFLLQEGIRVMRCSETDACIVTSNRMSPIGHRSSESPEPNQARWLAIGMSVRVGLVIKISQLRIGKGYQSSREW